MVALAAADAFAERLRGLFQGFRAVGMAQRLMVRELNNLCIPSARGGDWSLIQVQRVLARL